MSDAEIKSGDQVVKDFLIAIASNPKVDAGTLGCITRLRAKGKVTKMGLLKELQIARSGDNSSDEA
ncbi:hypothetical protein [Lacipirellula sp.]|uniref:hypothetical protein n=1 Tax=Lacipirellula sp. TaxID=2691419 RepID=UPI003D0F3532